MKTSRPGTARRLHRETGLALGWPSGLFEARHVRRLHQEHRQRSAGQPELWASTAVFITFDEGGGYYDSGYIQPVDFFGDGTRIPLLIVSPYHRRRTSSTTAMPTTSPSSSSSRGTGASKPLTGRSRDNLPNPKTARPIRMCRPTARRSAICSTRSTSEWSEIAGRRLTSTTTSRSGMHSLSLSLAFEVTPLQQIL